MKASSSLVVDWPAVTVKSGLSLNWAIESGLWTLVMMSTAPVRSALLSAVASVKYWKTTSPLVGAVPQYLSLRVNASDEPRRHSSRR
ncbi:hypothetical protein D9M70_584310 [compost metagenome]